MALCSEYYTRIDIERNHERLDTCKAEFIKLPSKLSDIMRVQVYSGVIDILLIMHL